MKTVCRILAVPVMLLLSLLIRLCAALLSHTALLFGIVSAVLSLLAVVVLLTTSVKNGLILLGIALVVSPIGIPTLAAKLLAGLLRVNLTIKGFISR